MPEAKKPSVPTINRVWIELDKPRDKEHAEQICQLVNTMLSRLLEDPLEQRTIFAWSERDSRYIVMDSHYGTYQVCVDNGHWFNLDYFGREI